MNEPLAQKPRHAWLNSTDITELSGTAEWLQKDSCYLYAQADKYRDAGGMTNEWLATRIQRAAKSSSDLAQMALDFIHELQAELIEKSSCV